ETPLTIAGLASLFVPWRRLWPTTEAQHARCLLAIVALVVWMSYLLYVPWDAWWYLRFLLPAWPAMAIGAASSIAAILAALKGPRHEYNEGPPHDYGRVLPQASAVPPGARRAALSGPPVVARIVVVCAVIAVGVVNVRRAIRLDVFNQQSGEAKYVETAKAVEAITSPDDVIISGQFSGSVRYYAGRLTLRWDFLDPQWLDRAVEWLAARGHHVYILLEAPEVDPFRARFASSAIGTVNWVPLVTFRGRSIQLHDAIRRDRFERSIEQPALNAIRECLPQRSFPTLR